MASAVMVPSAGADPKQFDAFKGTGSDTTQDILNAFAGFAGGLNYTPLQTTLATGNKQIVSFDAVGTDCIVAKPGGRSFLRPNGSSNGRRALSRTIDGGTWPASTTLCGGPKTIGGEVDFARSSAGPPAVNPGGPLVYVPFGRDGLSFAYYKSDGGAITNLTSGQLLDLFTAGPQMIGGVEIVPCGIQTGSGTYQSWNTAVAVTTVQEDAATATCQAATASPRIQENDGNGLKAKGDSAALLGKQVIVGFSAANFISQSNGVVASQLPVGGVVDLGDIDGQAPYAGTAPNLVPGDLYSSTTFGRDVFNVLHSVKVDGFGSGDLKNMFVGSASQVCAAVATINAFGFASLGASCGATTLRGDLLS